MLTVALRASQSSPPAVAEFAPQAQNPIQQAPSEQTSRFGNGLNGEGTGPQMPSPPSSPAAIPAGAVFSRCVGDPPRQIEDPQSPPCVPFWVGRNGGATAQGVSALSVSIIIPNDSGKPENDCTDGSSNRYLPLIKFFNQRFQFYGRQLVAHCYGAQTGTAAQMQADAVKNREVYGAFGTIGEQTTGGSETYYYDQNAKEGIVSIAQTQAADSGHLSTFSPYEWTYEPPADLIEGNLAAFMCGSLAGRPAAYAGGLQLNRPRKFGAVFEEEDGLAADPQPLVNGLAACGASLEIQNISHSNATGTAAAAIARFNADNVTSVVWFGDHVDSVYYLTAAQAASYFPEWLFTSYAHDDEEATLGAGAPRAQDDHAFGITFLNKRLPIEELPAYWAYRGGDPSWSGTPGPYDNAGTVWNDQTYYYEYLLELASGIQMAGPHLTAANFRSGLLNQAFPNPGCDGPPYYQACVAFDERYHTMNTSAQVIWWSDTASRQGSAGGWCYYDLGRRFNIGDWPKTAIGLFDTSSACE